MKARTLLVMLAAVAAVVMAAPASAGCLPAHLFGSFDTDYGTTWYIEFPAGYNTSIDPNPAAPTGGMIGRFWQPANRTSHFEGTGCPMSTWLFPGANANQFYIDGALGGNSLGDPCDNIGCPSGSMILQIEAFNPAGGSCIVTSRSIETPERPFYYYFMPNVQTNGVFHCAPAPKPYVAGSTKVGSTVNVAMGIRAQDVSPSYLPTAAYPDPVAGGVVTALKLYKRSAASPPPLDRLSWGAPVRTIAYTGGDVVIPTDAADCTNPTLDTYYALSVVQDNGSFESDYLSAPARVNCNPALAEPGKFKKIDKKPKGKK